MSELELQIEGRLSAADPWLKYEFLGMFVQRREVEGAVQLWRGTPIFSPRFMKWLRGNLGRDARVLIQNHRDGCRIQIEVHCGETTGAQARSLLLTEADFRAVPDTLWERFVRLVAVVASEAPR